MSVLNSIREFIQINCPFLDSNGRINVNYLPDKPVEYCLEAVPADPILKKYTDGGALKQALFLFASREFYGEDILENMKISKFYDMFSDWIDNLKILPELSEDKTAQKFERLTDGYLIYNEIGEARYQIQLKLIYTQEERKF